MVINNGDLARAERLAHESVDLLCKLKGNNHPATAWGIHHLGLALASQKKWDEAETCYRKALAIFQKQYDIKHLSVSLTLRRLAALLSAKGDQAGLAALLAQYGPVSHATGGQNEFGATTGTFPVEAARGKYVTYSGWIMTKNVDACAGLWWRADGPKGEVLAFDNLHLMGPRGTMDWARYAIDLDIPQETEHIYFGLLMPGKGQAWFDGLEVKLDGKDYHAINSTSISSRSRSKASAQRRCRPIASSSTIGWPSLANRACAWNRWIKRGA